MLPHHNSDSSLWHTSSDIIRNGILNLSVMWKPLTYLEWWKEYSPSSLHITIVFWNGNSLSSEELCVIIQVLLFSWFACSCITFNMSKCNWMLKLMLQPLDIMCMLQDMWQVTLLYLKFKSRGKIQSWSLFYTPQIIQYVLSTFKIDGNKPCSY
jgi:hypothetical protein